MKLFAYGSLMKMLRTPIGDARLEDHKKVPHPAWGKSSRAPPVVVPERGSVVDGVLFEVDGLQGCDYYEGDYYKRVKMVVKVGNEKVKAWVYVEAVPPMVGGD